MPPIVIALLLCALAFDAFCLVSLARNEAGNLPKWAWALICLIQTPSGAIMYMSIGHIGRPRPMPPGDAKP